MRPYAVLDIATLIWDVDHFQANRPGYYTLMEQLPEVFDGILQKRIHVLLRGELSEEIYHYFPYRQLPNEYQGFQTSTMYFLSHANLVRFPGDDDPSVSCDPELLKEHYDDSTKQELRYLVSYLHQANTDNNKILSFRVCWGDAGDLELTNSHQLTIRTLLCDNPDEHPAILDSVRRIFEHNPKHNAYKASEDEYFGRRISGLSCYNERTGDSAEAQALLDKAFEYRGGLFSYDERHQTFVRFVPTGGNKYHAFDVELSEDDLINIRNRGLQ